MKFLLTGVLNFRSMGEGIASTLAGIANQFPRLERKITRFQVDSIKRTIGQLYAAFLVFLREAVKWYSKGSASTSCKYFIKYPPRY